mgnify:CR=1 FL=1
MMKLRTGANSSDCSTKYNREEGLLSLCDFVTRSTIGLWLNCLHLLNAALCLLQLLF